jgi:phosphoribosylamine--glycine ligase
MRLLIVDPQGVALDFATRCQEAGHSVKHFITQTEKTKHIGRGIVDVVDDLQKWLFWPTIIFNTDNTKYLREMQRAREARIVVISATEETAAWELQRTIGQQVLRRAGIAVPAYVEFNDYDKAIAYVKKHMVRFVSKPSGDDDKSLSYVAKSPEDMVYMLERWKRAGKLKTSFIIQEFIDGTEMAVGGWFGPNGFARGWCENFEFKKAMRWQSWCGYGRARDGPSLR